MFEHPEPLVLDGEREQVRDRLERRRMLFAEGGSVSRIQPQHAKLPVLYFERHCQHRPMSALDDAAIDVVGGVELSSGIPDANRWTAGNRPQMVRALLTRTYVLRQLVGPVADHQE